MIDKNRDLTLDALKGIAIFLVLAGHVLNLNHMEDPYLYDGIKAVQMPLFMIVSGYLCGMGRKVTNLKEWWQILRKRAIAYLLPFFVWILVLYPLDFPGAVIDTLFHLDYGLWFLMTLFLLTAMVYTAQLVASLAGSRRSLWELLFWGSIVAMSVFVFQETMLGWQFLSPALTRLYIPFYMAGYMVTAYGPWLRSRFLDENGKRQILWERTKGGLCVGASLVFVGLIVFCDLVDLSTLFALARQILASFAGCYVIFWLCRRWKDGKAKRAAAWLGTYTLELYALHYHFATLLNQGITYELYSWQGIVFAVTSFAAMSLITAVLIFVTKKIPLLDLLLYGKRRRKRSVNQ